MATDFVRLRRLEEEIEKKGKIAADLEESIKRIQNLMKSKEKVLDTISHVGDNFENLKKFEAFSEEINLYHKRIQKSFDLKTQTTESLQKVLIKCEKLGKNLEDLKKEAENLGLAPNLNSLPSRAEDYERRSKKLRTLTTGNNSELKVLHSKIKKLTEDLATLKSEEQSHQSIYENLTKSATLHFSIASDLREKGFNSARSLKLTPSHRFLNRNSISPNNKVNL